MGGEEDAVPQRQGIVGNAAVVVREWKRDAAQEGCSRGAGENAVPQRQGVGENAAVVVGGRKRDAAQKGCGRGGEEDAVPQWQGIADFATVVVGAGEKCLQGYRRMTETSRGPWAPMTRACSMSAVLEGPAMKLPKS